MFGLMRSLHSLLTITWSSCVSRRGGQRTPQRRLTKVDKVKLHLICLGAWWLLVKYSMIQCIPPPSHHQLLSSSLWSKMSIISTLAFLWVIERCLSHYPELRDLVMGVGPADWLLLWILNILCPGGGGRWRYCLDDTLPPVTVSQNCPLSLQPSLLLPPCLSSLQTNNAK